MVRYIITYCHGLYVFTITPNPTSLSDRGRKMTFPAFKVNCVGEDANVARAFDDILLCDLVILLCDLVNCVSPSLSFMFGWAYNVRNCFAHVDPGTLD